MEGREHVSPDILETIEGESISFFDVKPGSNINLEVSFGDDGRKIAKFELRVDRPARREDWERGSFTVLGAEFSFDAPGAETLVGRTGSIDSAVTYRKGYMPPFTLARIAHITKGRHLIMNFDIPDQPNKVNRVIPFILDCNVSPPSEP